MIQGTTRSRIRQQKLRITFFGYFLVLLFFASLQVISIVFFTQGFLLSREVPDIISNCSDEVQACLVPKFEKAIVLVIDALRFDFAIPVEGSEMFYHNNFPILYELHTNQPQKSVLLKFIADPPTTTLQRLKGLTTGSLPTFIDAGSNFNGDEIDEDNWVLQLYNHNKSVAFMGDDTWQALFKKYINPQLNFPYPSLNVWDFHTVDNGVLENLHPLLKDPQKSSKWDVLIGHFLGVDHIGHRYGPNHHTMKEKLNQMNEEIKKVIEEMDDSTLLVVMGDHGMDSTGNHGGDSSDELESTLFMYTKKKNFQMNKQKVKANAYDISKLGTNYRTVNQIDLVPTISLLLGLPIPHNNLGFPIDELFESDKVLNQVSYKVVQQINQFRMNSNNEKIIKNQELNDKYAFLISNYERFSGNKKYTSDLISISKSFQYDNLEYCKSLWARFDMKFIVFGLSLLALSFVFILTYSRSIPSVRVSTMSFEFLGSVIAMSLLGIVLSLSIYIVLMPHNLMLRHCLAGGVGIGMVIGFWAPIMDRFSVNWLIHQIFDFFIYNFNSWSFMGLIYLVLHCLIFASNSYVIWEDKMASFFLSMFGVCGIISIASNTKTPQESRILGILHCLTFVVVTRLISMVNLCREEQGDYCRPTFEVTWWSVLLLHVMAYFLPLVIKSFYRLTNSYHSAAPLWMKSGFRFLLFMNATYWTLEYMDDNGIFEKLHLSTSFTHFLTNNLIKSFKLAISRIVLFISLVLANYGWSRGPLCVKIDFSNPEPNEDSKSSPDDSQELGEEKPTATILGYENIYGSSYFLLVINFAAAIMLTSKPLGALSIAGLLVQILSFLEIMDLLDLRRNLISPIIFGLLAYQNFFSTGHQATIPSIQWDVAFLTNDDIMFPFTHINLVLNNFGSFILVCLAIPLVILWRVPPTNKPIAVLSQVISITTSLITYQTLLSLSSFIFTAHFRRHLMVWKIFAPRFMLNGVLQVLINVVLIFITLWFGVNKVLSQVNRIFGK
ncbi:hypothetical protein CANTEDRAFT_125231 [Yamadazyma tenuis ATCC 10573]|uniref:Uncharacterized protein n=1 Tax=Candida tenuis (strain ATCC 10573 / BCRC 21748 / CBS 615 / JCM 9827 / NBRC 10315 / NRRL Y-1498 / VKM Y-70) TaxID=590646 RepID=G3B9K2_CANTC|nr:uncharacterized protein CANTEDRAFT_125231 [Yamadazyma tenuis ATCC 10573]EGV61911.1 hypothetical protein CANTEDRAFT_125231 [Yamadazyma tenuis ATCC 10573]